MYSAGSSARCSVMTWRRGMGSVVGRRLKREKIYVYTYSSLVAQTVTNPPAMWEAWVRSWLGKIPWRGGMATDSTILAWRIPWTEEPGGLQPMGSQRVGHEWETERSTAHSWFPLLYKKQSQQEARRYNGKKRASLTSGAGKIGQPLVKEWN